MMMRIQIRVYDRDCPKSAEDCYMIENIIPQSRLDMTKLSKKTLLRYHVHEMTEKMIEERFEHEC